MRWIAAAALATLAVLFACTERVQLKPMPRRPPPALVYVGDKSCMVQDFDFATDLPDGAKNLGWVVVAQADAGDEGTYLELRRQICALGGDALSQPAWVREGEDEQPKLKANAWLLP